MASRTRFLGFLVIGALGFFALVAQTLLFRAFFGAFEGSDLGVAAFLTSWLVWIAVGAAAARWETPVHRALTRHFPIAALLYFFAFFLQHALVLHVRALIGVEAYELFPLAPMIAMAFVVNAPVSFLTGFLFTRACAWAADACALPVARVYILETFGSGLGALAGTALLAYGASEERVFLIAASVVAISVAAARVIPGPRRIGILNGALAAAAIGLTVLAAYGGVARAWSHWNDVAAWSRLLPADSYQGGFTTAQARYMYGERQGQFIVMTGGGAVETLPPGDHDAELAAIHLAQYPDARNVLVFGEGAAGVCLTFRAFPQIQQVTWMNPDPEYPAALLRVGRVGRMFQDARIDVPAFDIRDAPHLSASRYDLVLLDLQDVTTLVRNRYCTTEFLHLIKGTLNPGGVVSVRVSGGANFIGAELGVLNASMVTTLSETFAHTALKPGDETWVFASDGDGLSEAPGQLRDRFAAIPGAAQVYPPEGVYSLYPPDRIAFLRRAHAETAAKTGAAFLLNTDAVPKAPLFAMLLGLKQAGWGSLARHVIVFSIVGIGLFICPIVLYLLLRLAYLLKSRREGSLPAPLDGLVLVFATGFAGMAANLVFLFLYQVRYGSLFLDLGLLTALFMSGSLLGSMLSERVLAHDAGEARAAHRLRRYLGLCLLVHIGLLAFAVFFAGTISAYSGIVARAFSIAPFFLCGAFTGVYFPIAAAWMRRAGRRDAASGSSLEALDNLGGAAGALVAGLCMLPLFGARPAFGVLAGLVAINLIPPLLHGRPRAARGDGFDRLVRPVGYVVTGIGILALATSQIWACGKARAEGEQLQIPAQDMAGETPSGEKRVLHEEKAQTAEGTPASYFRVEPDGQQPGGYVFETGTWAPGAYGYGGPLHLAAYVDANGVLLDYRIVRSNETPAYVNLLRDWKQRVVGRNLFEPDPFKGVDAVTGATITGDAILNALQTAGRAFATHALGKQVAEAQTPSAGPVYTLSNARFRDFLCLAAFTLAALVLRYRPRWWTRRVLLLAGIVAMGALFNLQYSMQHVVSLLSLHVGPASLGAAWFLVLCVPVVVLLFGNVYCGYLCPFGAVQELVADLVGSRADVNPGKSVWRYGRALKYGLLLLFVLLYAGTRENAVLQTDPLIAVWAWRDRTAWIVAGVCLVLAMFYRRFWCRNLCPAGAFLSLLNGVRLLRRITPVRRPHHCDLGVRTPEDFDCICCDRCLLPRRAVAAAPDVTLTDYPPPGRRCSPYDKAFLAVALAATLLFAGLTLSNAGAFSSARTSGAPSMLRSGGKPRDLDVDKVKELIRRQQLSGHEAEFYKPVPPEGEGEAPPSVPPAGTP